MSFEASGCNIKDHCSLLSLQAVKRLVIFKSKYNTDTQTQDGTYGKYIFDTLTDICAGKEMETFLTLMKSAGKEEAIFSSVK